jgi:uncharacterized RDD family membrane protein YckC
VGVVELAPVGRRVVAVLLDIAWIVPLVLGLRLVSWLVGAWPPTPGADMLVEVIIGLVIVSFWAEFGATPGKRMLGLVIVDAGTGGRPPLPRLLLRYVGYLLSALPLFLGFLWALWDPRRQGWHDKLAQTVVVVRPSTGGGS